MYTKISLVFFRFLSKSFMRVGDLDRNFKLCIKYRAVLIFFTRINLKIHQIIGLKSQKSPKRALCYNRNLGKIDFLGIYQNFPFIKSVFYARRTGFSSSPQCAVMHFKVVRSNHLKFISET